MRGPPPGRPPTSGTPPSPPTSIGDGVAVNDQIGLWADQPDPPCTAVARRRPQRPAPRRPARSEDGRARGPRLADPPPHRAPRPRDVSRVVAHRVIPPRHGYDSGSHTTRSVVASSWRTPLWKSSTALESRRNVSAGDSPRGERPVQELRRAVRPRSPHHLPVSPRPRRRCRGGLPSPGSSCSSAIWAGRLKAM